MHGIEGLVCGDNKNQQQKEPKQAKLKPKRTSTQKGRKEDKRESKQIEIYER